MEDRTATTEKVHAAMWQPTNLLGQLTVKEFLFSNDYRIISIKGILASLMMLALGGTVNGGLYGTAGTLENTPDNPTLENNGRDVRHETDFRSVYARVIDDWLGASSVNILGADFRNPAIDFV